MGKGPKPISSLPRLGCLSPASGAEHEAWPVGRVGLEGLATWGSRAGPGDRKPQVGVCPTQPGESVTPIRLFPTQKTGDVVAATSWEGSTPSADRQLMSVVLV